MSDNTCPAGKGVCTSIKALFHHPQEPQCLHHTNPVEGPHHADKDGTPCGEGCERRTPPPPGIAEAVATALEAERKAQEKSQAIVDIDETKRKDIEAQEKPGPVGEERRMALDTEEWEDTIERAKSSVMPSEEAECLIATIRYLEAGNKELENELFISKELCFNTQSEVLKQDRELTELRSDNKEPTAQVGAIGNYVHATHKEPLANVPPKEREKILSVVSSLPEAARERIKEDNYAHEKLQEERRLTTRLREALNKANEDISQLTIETHNDFGDSSSLYWRLKKIAEALDKAQAALHPKEKS